jgi:hypothetical protein
MVQHFRLRDDSRLGEMQYITPSLRTADYLKQQAFDMCIHLLVGVRGAR